MSRIQRVVSITPVFKEPREMILEFQKKIEGVRKALANQGVHLDHYYLDDEATELPEQFPRAIRHRSNMGLAKTLVDGYVRIIANGNIDPVLADIVIRLDAQEHDPWKILDIVDVMEHTDADAVFLPVYYWIEGQLRPSMREVQKRIIDFSNSLSPISQLAVLGTYNQIFPLGYQAFRIGKLARIVPRLEDSLEICKEITGRPATWGLDLLVILLTASMGIKTDSFFGGWSTPWKENRTAEHINAQREKARVMVEVALRLGCKVI